MTRCLLPALLLLALAVDAQAAPRPRVAVAPPQIPPGLAGAPDEPALGAAVARGLSTGPVEVVGLSEVGSIARRAAAAGLACDAHTAACAARLAAFAGLDFVVVTRVVEDGGGPGVELELIDGADGRRLRARQAPVDDLAVGVAAAAAALLADGPVPGTLTIAGPAGVAVTVDGTTRGVAPLELAVGAGLHEVNGRTVRVPAGGVAEVSLDDVARGGEADDGTITLGLGVAGGLGAAVGLLAGIGAAVVAPEAARRDAYTARAWNDAVATGQGLVAVAVVGAGVAAVAGGLWAARALPATSEAP